MGRIKGKNLKTASKDLLQRAGAQFSADFAHNKQVLKDLGILQGNRIERNKLAGDLTRHKKQELAAQKQEEAA